MMNKLNSLLGLFQKPKKTGEAIPPIKLKKVVGFDTPVTFNEIANNILTQRKILYDFK
jgi:hypothetical protein